MWSLVRSTLTGIFSRPSPGTIRTGSPSALTPTRSPVIKVIQWVTGATDVPVPVGDAAADGKADHGTAVAGRAVTTPAASASTAAATTLPGPLCLLRNCPPQRGIRAHEEPCASTEDRRGDRTGMFHFQFGPGTESYASQTVVSGPSRLSPVPLPSPSPSKGTLLSSTSPVAAAPARPTGW